MKTARGTARAEARSELPAFWVRQCRRRDEVQGHRLFGDANKQPLPEYYIQHQKAKK